MQAVGIRELKDKLSYYLRLVDSGESVLVTDRGSVVAELRPPGRTTQAPGLDPAEAALELLARRGGAVAGAPHDPKLYARRPRVLGEGRLAELLSAERAER